MALNITLSTLFRGLHTLTVSAWLGGGLGVILLLMLGSRADSPDEVKAYNLVITAIDDLLITPGAAGTVATGLLLSGSQRKTTPLNRWIATKLLATLSAIIFGLLFLAPWLRGLLAVSLADGSALFFDWDYLNFYRLGLAGSLFQMAILLGLFWGSVKRGAAPRGNRCSGCHISHATR